MRSILVFVAACILVGACTKPNPDACCTTPDQCTSFGIDQLRPCSDGRVCTDNGACIASQCDVNADCTDPASPVCVAHQCVAKCSTDTDCTDSAAPKCDADGVCVACIDDAQCTTATAPICDGSAHSCRGCAEDTECPSGVCLEFSGVCATVEQILYLSPNGASNSTCDVAHPCLTFADVITLLSPQRDVVRLLGGQVGTGSNTVNLIDLPLFIDGNGTEVIGANPAFLISGGATVVIEGVAVTGTTVNPFVLAHVTGGHLDVFDLTANGGGVDAAGGDVEVSRSTLKGASTLTAESGTLKVLTSTFDNAFVKATGGTVTVARNTFHESSDGSVTASGASVVIENNVIVDSSQFADSMNVLGALAGSTVRFNTFVNTSGVTDSAQPLHCDGATTVTSNIFAWNTTATPGCLTTHTLFDTHTSQLGEGNQSADVSTFFVDFAGADFHLQSGSPALAHGDPNAGVNSDFDDNARPNPAGTPPDVGAYEAP